jgi:hypothetical protein
VGGPGIALVFLKPVEETHVLGEPHRLENPHVFAGGKDVCPVELGVYLHYSPRRVFLFVKQGVV